MQNYQIPDSAIRASTSYNVNSMGPENGRLHFQAKSGEYGAWAVSRNDQFQWFLVDFGSFTKVTGCATQGRQDGNWWVKTYSLSFSYEGVFFEDYKENNVKKVSVEEIIFGNLLKLVTYLDQIQLAMMIMIMIAITITSNSK